MPGVTIKAALKTILSNAFVAPMGDGRVIHVETQYPRLSDQIGVGDFPRITIFERGHTENRLAGGAGTPPYGVKNPSWDVVIHAATLLDQPLEEGDAWDQLLDDIEAQLRLNPTLGITTTKVWAESITRRTLPPDRNQARNAFNAFISLQVEELLYA